MWTGFFINGKSVSYCSTFRNAQQLDGVNDFFIFCAFARDKKPSFDVPVTVYIDLRQLLLE